MSNVTNSLGLIVASLVALLIDRSSSHGYFSGLILTLIHLLLCINAHNLELDTAIAGDIAASNRGI
jgi:hypothetical protein